MCMCVHGFVYFLIDFFFFTFSLCLCSSSFTFLFENIVFFFQGAKVLFIASLIMPQFKKHVEVVM
jgi:hypothetical protein